jgi:hypothetical protein
MQLQIMCPCRDPSCKQYSTHIHGDLYSDAKQPLQHVESESITAPIDRLEKGDLRRPKKCFRHLN